MTFSQGLLYAVVPAAVGFAAAAVVLLLARREVRLEGEALRAFFTLFGIPGSVVVFTLVGAVFAADAGDEATLPLLLLGAAAFVTTGAQGFLASRQLGDLRDDPRALGRILVPIAAAEIPVLGALFYLLSTLGVLTSSTT